MKKWMAMLLALAMTLCAAGAMAGVVNPPACPFDVTGGDSNGVTWDGSVLTISKGSVTISMNNDGATTSNRIVVQDGATVTLAGVQIDTSENDYAPAMTVSGNTTVILAAGSVNTLNSGYYRAGLQKEGTGTLVITCEKAGAGHVCSEGKCGSLTATGGDNGAGIGGGRDGSGSYITINGGVVTATGGDTEGFGAGIGGGRDGSGSDINISGGVVTATGGDNGGAGIGGGYGGSGSYITISGGTVTATGAYGGAGIGGGNGWYDDYTSTYIGGSGSYITISGGDVTATGGDSGSGAGIGGGTFGSGSYITINSGTVKATGGKYGAGIGGGDEGNGSNITINGGDVTANGNYAAGIGGGNHGNGTGITISGGEVKAQGGKYGAGIGGGEDGSGSYITINGGVVTATGGTSGAGIGGGICGDWMAIGGNGSDIKISGGDVTATGGKEGGAGIGGGQDGNGSNIEISGGDVKATSDYGGAGIGGGYSGAGTGIEISGGTVEAKCATADAVGSGNNYTGNTSTSVTIVGSAAVKIEASAGENWEGKDAKPIDGSPFTSRNENIYDLIAGMQYFKTVGTAIPAASLPQTGDASMLGAWAALLGACAAGAAGMKLRRKRGV